MYKYEIDTEIDNIGGNFNPGVVYLEEWQVG